MKTKHLLLIGLCLSLTCCVKTNKQPESESNISGVVTEKTYTITFNNVEYSFQTEVTSYNNDSYVNGIEVLSVTSSNSSIEVSDDYEYWFDIYAENGEGLETLLVKASLNSDNNELYPQTVTFSIPLYSVKLYNKISIPFTDEIDCVLDLTDDEKNPEIQHLELYGAADSIKDTKFEYTWNNDVLDIKVSCKIDGKDTEKELSLTQQEIDAQRESNKQQAA